MCICMCARTVAERRGGLFPPEKPAKKSGHILALGSGALKSWQEWVPESSSDADSAART